MNLKEYIELAYNTNTQQKCPLPSDVLHSLFGLTTEIGELTDHFKGVVFYGKSFDPVNIEEELGDIMWYMALLCHYYGIDFEKVLEKNIEKLRVRYPNKFSTEKAINRNLEAERKVLESSKESPNS